MGSDALTPETRDKLQKLIRVLSSDKEGEVLGAVAAINRVLENVGLDFDTFAEVLADPKPINHPNLPPPRPLSGQQRRQVVMDWKNWCEQQRYENRQRELREMQLQKPSAPPPKALPKPGGVKA